MGLRVNILLIIIDSLFHIEDAYKRIWGEMID